MKDQPSSTALFVANGLWWLSQQPSLRGELPEGGRSFLNLPAPHLWGSLVRAGKAAVQQAAVPGIYLHFAARKRRVETYVRRAIEEGATQLVVLGAGFDTLSLRMLDAYPALRVLEVDHPATQAAKRRVLAGQGIVSERLTLVPLDLSRSTLEDTLKAHPAFRADRTVFVAEGLLMYLREAEVQSLFEFVGGCGPDARLVFTYMEERRPGDYQFANATVAARWWLWLKHETFTWGLRPENVGGFLRCCGLQLVTQATHPDLHADLRTRAGRASRRAMGENVALAGVAS